MRAVYRILVLNSTYQPLNTTSMKRAMKMLYLNKAEVVSLNGCTIKTPRMTISVPSVIRLFTLITIPVRQVPLTRKYILMRDHYTCQYCGIQEFKSMTIDHIVPRSQGGVSTWENLVCACKYCNHKKNNRNPREANMDLLSNPKKPHFRHLLNINMQKIPEEWKPYLK